MVAVPCHRCRPYVRGCVEPARADARGPDDRRSQRRRPEPPWPALAGLEDPQLVRFDLAPNRGRYFADQVVLQATDAPYLLIQDADDWSDPRRVAVLLELVRASTPPARSTILRHATGRPPVPVDPFGLAEPLDRRFEHRANHHGLFRTDALRAVGGMFGGFRIGYDTFLVNALAMTGRIATPPGPLYHWRVRADSLTSSAATGARSRHRAAVAAELAAMYAQAFAAYEAYLAGGLDAGALAAAIRTIAASRVTDADRAALGAQAARLRAALQGRRRPRHVAPAVAVTPARLRGDVDMLLADRALPWSEWTISRALAVELAERLERGQPRRMLEAGSGISTIVLAQYAARSGARDGARARPRLRGADPRGAAAPGARRPGGPAATAPLRSVPCADGRARRWYGAEPGHGFDFVLVDQAADALRPGRGAVRPRAAAGRRLGPVAGRRRAPARAGVHRALAAPS